MDDQKITKGGKLNWAAQGVGRRRAISKSKSKNKIATRKNRIEYGSRADPSGSNPHSYGDNFSESGLSEGSQKLMKAKISDRVNAIKTKGVITFSWSLTKTK